MTHTGFLSPCAGVTLSVAISVRGTFILFYHACFIYRQRILMPAHYTIHCRTGNRRIRNWSQQQVKGIANARWGYAIHSGFRSWRWRLCPTRCYQIHIVNPGYSIRKNKATCKWASMLHLIVGVCTIHRDWFLIIWQGDKGTQGLKVSGLIGRAISAGKESACADEILW